jgi:small conductance mechanosensitive channel
MNIFENETLNSVVQEALFLIIVFTAVSLSLSLIGVVVDKYFQQIYKAAKKSGRTISKKRYDTLARAIKSMAKVAVWVVAGVMILAHFVPNPTALVTGAGAIGIFLGIAGKDIVMDIYVGLMALIEDQYRVGDVVVIDPDHSGTVEDISLRTVKLRDIDGNVHIVPHSMARAIINKTYDYSLVNVELGAAYESDIEKIKKVINDTGLKLAEEEHWKTLIIEPIHYQTMLRFDESQLTFRAHGKVKAGKQWEVASEFRIRIKQAFDKNGIEIPFPQRVIRTISEPAVRSKASPTK